MPRRKTNFGDSLFQNNNQYGMYLERLTELAISMFEWKNLPDSCDERFLELTLFTNGYAVFFKDEDLSGTGLSDSDTGSYLALPVATNGRWNVYNIPTKRRAYASNGYNKNLDVNNSVVIYNNLLHTNSINISRTYARRLYNLDRIVDVNANAQKTPVLILANEQQRLTMLQVYQKWDGNEPVIFGDRDLDMKLVQALRTDAPYIADKIQALKTELWNEALTYLGISNISFQKKERMISDEVLRNQGGTIASRYSRLNARRQSADKINKMFGLNIEVNYREDYREADDEIMFHGETESEGDKKGATSGTPVAIDLRTQ